MLCRCINTVFTKETPVTKLYPTSTTNKTIDLQNLFLDVTLVTSKFAKLIPGFKDLQKVELEDIKHFFFSFPVFFQLFYCSCTFDLINV